MFQSHRPLVVEVPGEIDLLPAPPLEGSLRRHIARGWPLDVGLDGVTFMEARVISVLLRLDTGVSGRHGRLRVRRADPALGRLFSLTCTDRRLDLLPRPAATGGSPEAGPGPVPRGRLTEHRGPMSPSTGAGRSRTRRKGGA
ncbi:MULTISPECIES: STAS domain-containing protein [unclassified Streptomyces]|uniref:STAS domain-containing protein n=1 Tax=unclassified Streptomyces TaxID=2593676 RepID=UPI00099BC0BD